MNTAFIIGDSFHNTLGLIRSLGMAHIKMVLILIAKDDPCRVLKSKYLRGHQVYVRATHDDTIKILLSHKDDPERKIIICTNDTAAKVIDSNEKILSQNFITPLRGKSIDKYFNKADQCKLASDCGLDVPFSIIYDTNVGGDLDNITFPVITKPIVSIEGSKSDIHICNDASELEQALQESTECKAFIIQQFIEKDFEINNIGLRTENGVFWGGSIRKIRHYPPVTGAATFARIYPINTFNVNTAGLELFLQEVGYYGPFSVEFVHKDGKNYFMEVNFRNDGLAYTATKAGVNLPAYYLEPSQTDYINEPSSIYMMDIWADFRNAKNGIVSIFRWVNQLRHTGCFIDLDCDDLAPFVWQLYDRFKIKKSKTLHKIMNLKKLMGGVKITSKKSLTVME